MSRGDWCERLENRTLLSGTDPITNDHPLWAIPRGSAVIDGVLDEDQWAGASQLVRSLAYNENVAATVYMMWDDDGVYLAADVLDQHLWADGQGDGAGNGWEVRPTTQSPSTSISTGRDQYFQATDFAIAYNIASFNDPKNDADGPVRRYKFTKGDGAGRAPDVGWFGDWGEINANGLDPELSTSPTARRTPRPMPARSTTTRIPTRAGPPSCSCRGAHGVGDARPRRHDRDKPNLILDDTGGTRNFSSHRYTEDRWRDTRSATIT